MKLKLSIVLFVTVSVATTISCARPSETPVIRAESNTARSAPSEPPMILDPSLPGGFKNAEPSSIRSDSFVIVLPEPGKVLLREQGSDPQPLDSRVLGEKIRAFGRAEIPPDQREVWIKSVPSVETSALAPILNEIAKNELDQVIFLTRSETSDAMVFEVKLADTAYMNRVLKPDPLTLTVSKEGSKFSLNKQQVDDLDALGKRLGEIFQEREKNKVLRKGTNEIEKTVVLRLDSFDTYGDLLSAIDTIRGVGSERIGLVLNNK